MTEKDPARRFNIYLAEQYINGTQRSSLNAFVHLPRFIGPPLGRNHSGSPSQDVSEDSRAGSNSSISHSKGSNNGA